MNRIKKKLLVQLNYFWLLYKIRTYAKNVGWDIVTKPFHLRLNRLNQADYTQLSIIKQIDIPIQGGLDPKILLSNKDNLKKNTIKILNIFKDHPYIFNLGHGVLPQTNPNMVDYLVKLVKDF